MAGKFLGRDAIIDTVKSEERANAIRKRSGLERHPIHAYACGCPDPNCGAFHTIDTDHTIPTPEECAKRLAEDNRERKPAKAHRKRIRS
ncbi:MAG: hypothetical protein K0Q72_2777 [Armatimonadetes bacterium]|jgi:hypothetical protein|nr:hypothetical protein [Armatimonadota bacterium]